MPDLGTGLAEWPQLYIGGSIVNDQIVKKLEAARARAQHPARVHGKFVAAVSVYLKARHWNDKIRARALIDEAISCGPHPWSARTEQQRQVLKNWNTMVQSNGDNPAFLTYEVTP